MIKILFFVLWLINSYDIYRVHAIHIDDLEIETQLKIINKPSVKSIQTKFGYIVDCVDIHKQPAFDHPLLKDHKLQRKPCYKSFEKINTKDSSNELIFGLQEEKCPKGTVPIRRTTKDELIQGKLSLYNQNKLQGVPWVHIAEVHVTPDFSPFYKVKGTNSIYNPRLVTTVQESLSHIFIENGNSKISFGWHVSPLMHGGNSATYFYSAWTSDRFKRTGCYNLQCPGFVQTHPYMFLGARTTNVSIYGSTSVETVFTITLDRESQNWWLNLFGHDIGYYPGRLFSNMTSADIVGWGGRTVTRPNTFSPQMGSGYFPEKNNFVHACYFINIFIQDQGRTDFGPEKHMTKAFADKPDCFGVEYYGDQGGTVGHNLQFGGPGGNCGD